MGQLTATIAIIALVIATGCKERAAPADLKIVTGKVIPADQTEFNATLLLNINGSPCTGQHIGKGYILTAAHCFIIAGEGADPTVRVTNFLGEDLFSLRPNEYKKFVAPSQSTSRMLSAGRTYDIPIPDLLIFIPLDENNIRKVTALNKFKLSSATQIKEQADRYSAGYGLVDYDQFDIDGKLRFGAAGISDVLEFGYATFWNREGQWAGGAPGDSGGPLFSVEGVDLVLHGVASNIQRKKDAAGLTVKVWTNYTRIDTQHVRDWIKDTTGLSYSDAQSGGNGNSGGPTDGQNPVDDGPPVVSPDQFVGIFKCKSPSNAAPFWIVDMDFNDSSFARIKESRFATATSIATPVVVEWRTDMIVDYGPVMVITNQTGGRIAFYTDDNRIEKMGERGNVVASLTCTKL